MKLTQRVTVLAGMFLLFLTAYAHAAPKTYAVAPFAVNGPQEYAYLEKAIAPMFSSRLYWAGHFQPLSLPGDVKAPAAPQEAAALQERARADYLVWGSVHIVGNSATLDVSVRDGAGKVWTKSSQALVNNIIPVIQRTADAISEDVFKRPLRNPGAAQKPAENAVQSASNPMNPDLLQNQTQPGQMYMNPQFRYAGGEDKTMLRSQALKFAGLSMEVADVDQDGKNEVVILGERAVYVGRFENNKLTVIGEFPLSLMLKPINLRIWESRNGLPRIIVNARDERKDVATMVLTFDGKEFQVDTKKAPYYLNVLRMPPDYVPVLLAQESDTRDPFRPGIYEAVKTQDGFDLGRRIKMPEFANIFAINWMPDKDGDKFLMLTDQERLRIYTQELKMLAETDEKYSGSSIGIELTDNPFGMTSSNDGVKTYYHVPIRMIVNDLDQDGTNEVIVLRPISTASQIFANYRTFPQGEIQSLFWDGLGMSLKWKTRRIKGTIVDFGFADVNNDGKLYLVVLANSHPGALGLSNRRAMVLAYPLDLTQVDPNTPPNVTE